MILAVDAGNTQIVIGCVENGKILHKARIASDVGKTEYEYAFAIKEVLELNGVHKEAFDGTIVSSVVPPLTDALAAALVMLTGKKPLIVGAGIKTELNIALDDPAQLGSDLVVGAVAALAAHKAPLIIIDMGTATTISVIDGRGRLIGGAIMPGIGVSQKALTGTASLLPKISIEAPKKSIGTNTIDCMKSGAVFGTAAMLDGLIDRMEAELGEKTTVIATGGFAEKVVPHCKRDIIYDGDLLLHGLDLLYAKNKRKRK